MGKPLLLRWRDKDYSGAQAVADAAKKSRRAVYWHLNKFGHLECLGMTPKEMKAYLEKPPERTQIRWRKPTR